MYFKKGFLGKVTNEHVLVTKGLEKSAQNWYNKFVHIFIGKVLEISVEKWYNCKKHPIWYLILWRNALK